MRKRKIIHDDAINQHAQLPHRRKRYRETKHPIPITFTPFLCSKERIKALKGRRSSRNEKWERNKKNYEKNIHNCIASVKRLAETPMLDKPREPIHKMLRCFVPIPKRKAKREIEKTKQYKSHHWKAVGSLKKIKHPF